MKILVLEKDYHVAGRFFRGGNVGNGEIVEDFAKVHGIKSQKVGVAQESLAVKALGRNADEFGSIIGPFDGKIKGFEQFAGVFSGKNQVRV